MPTILNLLETSIKPDNVNDLFRQIDETKLFIRQAERSLTHV